MFGGRLDVCHASAPISMTEYVPPSWTKEARNSERHRSSTVCSPGRCVSSKRMTHLAASRSAKTGASPYRPPRVPPGGPSHSTSPMRAGSSSGPIEYQSNSPKSLIGVSFRSTCARRWDGRAASTRSAHSWSCSREITDLPDCAAATASTKVVRPEPHSRMGPSVFGSHSSMAVTRCGLALHHGFPQPRASRRSSLIFGRLPDRKSRSRWDRADCSSTRRTAPISLSLTFRAKARIFMVAALRGLSPRGRHGIANEMDLAGDRRRSPGRSVSYEV
jgi:hypothetical protein